MEANPELERVDAEKLAEKESRDIIKKWENNELEAGEYKDYLDIPENQKTGILREINGEFVEIPYTDPIFTMLAEARNNAGSNLHPVFEGVDFSSMSAASKLGSAYGKANKLMEEGKEFTICDEEQIHQMYPEDD